MLGELDRDEDYIELSLDGQLTWNPLSATWLDSYSLAYTVASLLNQLFGKGKEPFWQQAYTKNPCRAVCGRARCVTRRAGFALPGYTAAVGRVAACLRRGGVRRSASLSAPELSQARQDRPRPHARTTSPVLVAGVLKRGLHT